MNGESETLDWDTCKIGHAQPLNFTREIDGTVYAVRAFFKEDARENITDKVQRIILKSDDNNKEI